MAYIARREAGEVSFVQNSVNHFVDKSTDPFYLLSQYLTYISKIENLSETTVKNRNYILRPFLVRLNKTDVTSITIYELDEYCIERSVEIKPSSLNMERQTLRSFFAYCQAYRMLEMAFDFRQIKRTKERPPRVVSFTREQVASVVNSTKHYQDQLIITLMYETGIRIGELINLSVEDIRSNQIQIRGKGSKDRMVFMPDDLARQIRDYTLQSRISTGRVFRPLQKHNNHASDRYTSAYAVRDRIKREFARLGYRMHPHQLRHSFALNWLQSGGDIRSLQKMLGHDSLETTQRYLDLTDDYMAKIYKKTIPTSILNRKDY